MSEAIDSPTDVSNHRSRVPPRRLAALRLLSNAVLLKKFGTRWVRDFRDPLQPNIQDGISITRAFGSSEPSVQRAFEHGRLPQRLATALRPHR